MGLATNKDEYQAEDQGSDPIKDMADFKDAFNNSTKDDVPPSAAEHPEDAKMVPARVAVDDAKAAEAKAVVDRGMTAPAKTFKEAFAAARKNPEAMAKGKFHWVDPTGKKTGWYLTAMAGESKPKAEVKAPVKPAPIITETKPETKVNPVLEKRPGIMQRMREKDRDMNAAVIAGAAKLHPVTEPGPAKPNLFHKFMTDAAAGT